MRGEGAKKLICAQRQRLHQSLCRWRTSTLRWIATARGGYHQAIRRNGDVKNAAAFPNVWYGWGSGGNRSGHCVVAQPYLRRDPCSESSGAGLSKKRVEDPAPGGFRFLSPCRKEQRDLMRWHGYVHNSRLNGTVIRWLPQSLTRQLSATSIGAAAPNGLPLVSVDSLISFPASPDSPLG